METWKMPAAGGAAVQVPRDGGGAAFESVDGEYLYYSKSAVGIGPLFRIPVSGGPEVQILPRLGDWASFAIGAKGIYFTPDSRTLQRLEFSSGKISTLANSERRFGGVTVSPDERFVVWSQNDRETAELTLVEGFR
jgi:hypothetical protein